MYTAVLPRCQFAWVSAVALNGWPSHGWIPILACQTETHAYTTIRHTKLQRSVTLTRNWILFDVRRFCISRSNDDRSLLAIVSPTITSSYTRWGFSRLFFIIFTATETNRVKKKFTHSSFSTMSRTLCAKMPNINEIHHKNIDCITADKDLWQIAIMTKFCGRCSGTNFYKQDWLKKLLVQVDSGVGYSSMNRHILNLLTAFPATCSTPSVAFCN